MGLSISPQSLWARPALNPPAQSPSQPAAESVKAKAEERAAFDQFKAQRYAEILSHEQAHQSAAGSLGGGIHIDFDSNGVAVGGHVPIKIPPLDPNNPETSYQSYSQVRNAALAPGDPSGQDCAVASKAQALMGQAQVLMARKKQKNPKEAES
jgi:hypothetical protein